MLTFPGITPILMTYQGKQGPACGREDIFGLYPFISAAVDACDSTTKPVWVLRNSWKYKNKNAGRRKFGARDQLSSRVTGRQRTGAPAEASAMRAKRRQKPLTKQVRALIILQVTHNMRGGRMLAIPRPSLCGH